MKKSEKISLLVYVDWLETLELLEPAERGLVFSNLLRQLRRRSSEIPIPFPSPATASAPSSAAATAC